MLAFASAVTNLFVASFKEFNVFFCQRCNINLQFQVNKSA